MTVVVSDTSPLRALSHLGLLGLLPRLFGEVLVPPAVDHELRNPKAPLPAVDAATVPGVRIAAPADQGKVAQFCRGLQRGEAEAIVLALEVGAVLLLIDERAGEAAARHAGLATLGVLGLLVRAKRAGLVGEVRSLLDDLQAGLNFFISAPVRARVLTLAGE